jgi:hypothetical protein
LKQQQQISIFVVPVFIFKMQSQSTAKRKNAVDFTMRDTSTCATEIDSKSFVQSILGEQVVCTLSDGRKASGRLMCVDRLYVHSP